VLPLGSATVSLMFPLPPGVNRSRRPCRGCPAVAGDQGRQSVLDRDAPASLGPRLLTTIVYVVLVPGTYWPTPSVLVMARSATRWTVSVSVAELLFKFGSVTSAGGVTVAVFTRSPVPRN